LKYEDSTKVTKNYFHNTISFLPVLYIVEDDIIVVEDDIIE